MLIFKVLTVMGQCSKQIGVFFGLRGHVRALEGRDMSPHSKKTAAFLLC
jgi:hypothetical protein